MSPGGDSRTSGVTPESVWLDVECGSYSADLPFWRRMAAAGGATACELLELGCGTGRVSLALAKQGVRVTALDVSEEAIGTLRRRAAAQALPLDAVVADASSFALGRKFDLVLAPMQFVQLFRSEEERSKLLHCVARHLKPGGRAAFALLDPADEPTVGEPPPLPDILEIDGWVYSSQPVAVRSTGGGAAIELERVRRAISPGGEVSESFRSDHLELLSCEQLEAEGRRAGLLPQGRERINATSQHVASMVAVLARAGSAEVERDRDA